MTSSDIPAFRTRVAKEVITGLVRRGGQVNEGACGVVTDEKHTDFNRLVYNVWFPVNPTYPVYDNHANFRVSESFPLISRGTGLIDDQARRERVCQVKIEGSFRLRGTNGDNHVTRSFYMPSGRSRQGRCAWEGVDAFLGLFRRIGQSGDKDIITQDVLDRALTLLWWGVDQSMKAVEWSPTNLEPLRKAWAEVAPLWTPPHPDDELPDHVRRVLNIPYSDEKSKSMPRTSFPTMSSIKAVLKTESITTVYIFQADMEVALIEWAKKNLGFNPPEGEVVEVNVHEEGCDDHGNEGEPAYAVLTSGTYKVDKVEE